MVRVGRRARSHTNGGFGCQALVPNGGHLLTNLNRMNAMKELILSFLRDEEGLTTVEYAVAGGLITLAVVGAFQALGGSVAGVINTIDGVLP